MRSSRICKAYPVGVKFAGASAWGGAVGLCSPLARSVGLQRFRVRMAGEGRCLVEEISSAEAAFAVGLEVLCLVVGGSAAITIWISCTSLFKVLSVA